MNGNDGSGGSFPMVITTLTPRMIRAILPRPPLSSALILGNAATLELNCDCYNKSESDGRYYTRGQADAAFAPFSTETGLQNLSLQVVDIDSRVTTLEGSPLPADISVNSISATGDWLTLVGGSSGTRIQDHANNTLFSMTTAEAFFGVSLAWIGGSPSTHPAGPTRSVHCSSEGQGGRRFADLDGRRRRLAG